MALIPILEIVSDKLLPSGVDYHSNPLPVVASAITVASVYGYMQKPMKYMSALISSSGPILNPIL